MTAETCSLSPEIQKKLVDGLLELFGDNIDRIILYGSVARGDDGPESDVDVAFILKNRPDSEARRRFIHWNAGLDLEYGKPFNILNIEKSLFERYSDVIPFYKSVRREGIVLWKAA